MIILPWLSLWRGLRPSGRGFFLRLKATRGWVLSSGITQLKFGQTALRWAAADQVGSSCSSASSSAAGHSLSHVLSRSLPASACSHAVDVLHASHMTTGCHVSGSIVMLMQNKLLLSIKRGACLWRERVKYSLFLSLLLLYFKLQQSNFHFALGACAFKSASLLLLRCGAPKQTPCVSAAVCSCSIAIIPGGRGAGRAGGGSLLDTQTHFLSQAGRPIYLASGAENAVSVNDAILVRAR